MIEIRGRVIVITGASSGIGRATAIECAREGMHVVVAARRKEKLDEVVEACRSHGVDALGVETDVTRPDDCVRLVDATLERFGSLYALYANAGYGVEAPMHEMSEASLRAIFETNFWGSMHAIRPALEHMRRVGSGHILLCSSCLSKLGVPYYGAYCATKACQDHVARAMRLELGGTGIHVSSV
ncbi:MAG: SDR family NAD(P)-dependent oxidoreductase, partial [Phycisphaerales bacterium]|nr:SDR family NAD(P)-dependent oxidoreductase [Phycisphaerales bacterium]